MHRIAILALDGVIPFDLSTPIEVFGRLRLPDGRAAYQVVVCAATAEVDAGAFTLRPAADLTALATADTVIVPGCADLSAPVPQPVQAALRATADAGTRIASICSGAFVLAAAGLLDGRPATTHWRAAADLAARYPAVRVHPDVLYVDDGQILTSAGAAAGLDLCLHLVRRDHGSAAAADAARLSVMPLERSGGQAQFIPAQAPPAPPEPAIEPLLNWLREQAAEPMTLARIADRAGMSPRTLHRRFREHTGVPPLRWLQEARIRQAQHLLEATDDGVEQISRRVGFGSPTAFRESFKRIVGTSPYAYRGAFRRPGDERSQPTGARRQLGGSSDGRRRAARSSTQPKASTTPTSSTVPTPRMAALPA
ncbi:GlxA family transcriptional regulator [Micromonospora sp. LOL_021]|uniref:GlxA family transcriptional regulator n=1 Tax=Micromonospora sp. LOL_021 TaxID=3345417 RepID=UPI003A840D74